MIETLHYEFHTVHLHHGTGDGVRVEPRPSDDAWLEDGLSVHEAARRDVMLDLGRRACGPWTDTDDDSWGEAVVNGYTKDGRAIVGLFAENPIHGTASLEQCAEALAELMSLARGDVLG